MRLRRIRHTPLLAWEARLCSARHCGAAALAAPCGSRTRHSHSRFVYVSTAEFSIFDCIGVCLDGVGVALRVVMFAPAALSFLVIFVWRQRDDSGNRYGF